MKGLARYEVLIDQRVERDLEKVPDHIIKRFLGSLTEFERDPLTRRPRFDAKHLKGLPQDSYRLRIGDYRVLYSVDKKEKLVRITTFVHRKKAYR